MKSPLSLALLSATLLSATLLTPASALAQDLCAVGALPLQGDLQSVTEQMVVQAGQDIAENIAAATPEAEEGGWLSFIGSSISNLTFDGMLDRYLAVEEVIERVEAGEAPGDLGIPTEDYRLRNVAEMTEIIQRLEGTVDNLAAYSLRDANASFYTLFGNEGGDFSNMDMGRYREIGEMSGDAAAEVLPEFEAELFRSSSDPDTVAFGNSLPANERLALFMFHNRWFTPDVEGSGGGGAW
jgi:hypothetical protein